MLRNDQQGRMQNLASGLTVSRHKGVVVGYLRGAIGVKMQRRKAERDVSTPSCHQQAPGVVVSSNVH